MQDNSPKPITIAIKAIILHTCGVQVLESGELRSRPEQDAGSFPNRARPVRSVLRLQLTGLRTRQGVTFWK